VSESIFKLKLTSTRTLLAQKKLELQSIFPRSVVHKAISPCGILF